MCNLIFRGPTIYIQRVTSSQDPKLPVRKIALALIPKLDKELDSMLADGIIVPVEKPTDWVNSLVVREKPNSSLRVCLDPRDLNKAIRREHHPYQQLRVLLLNCMVLLFFLG